MSPELEELFAQMWADGVPLKQIANEIGYSFSALNKYACAHRDKFPMRKVLVPENDSKRARWMLRLSAGRCTVGEVAEALGVTRRTVLRWIRKSREDE